MDAQEKLDVIKVLLLDKKTLQDAKRIELLERLYDRVHIYHMDNKHYQQLANNERLDLDEYRQAYIRAVQSETDMFAVMHELDTLKKDT